MAKPLDPDFIDAVNNGPRRKINGCVPVDTVAPSFVQMKRDFTDDDELQRINIILQVLHEASSPENIVAYLNRRFPMEPAA